MLTTFSSKIRNKFYQLFKILFLVLLIATLLISFIHICKCYAIINPILLGIVLLISIIIVYFFIYRIFIFFKQHSNQFNQRIIFINCILMILLAFSCAYLFSVKHAPIDGNKCLIIAKSFSHSFNWHDVPSKDVTYALFLFQNNLLIILLLY